MNLATGVKEARLNVPDSFLDEASHSDLTVVDKFNFPGNEGNDNTAPLSNNPFVKAQQAILPPQHDVAEGSLFSDSAATIKDGVSRDPKGFFTALVNLEDLSHSYHWGHTLGRDEALTRKLFQLLLPSNLSIEVRSMATLVLGTAIHNNPSALGSALSHFYNDAWPEGPLEAVLLAMLHEQSTLLLHRMIFLLSAFCQDQTQLSRFVAADGLEILLKVFDVNSVGTDDKDKLRGKIGNFLLDRFLQPKAENLPTSRDDDFPPERKESSGVDDSWVVVEKAQDKDTDILERSEIRDRMIPWIAAFGRSLDGWKNVKSANQDAISRVQEASTAMTKKFG